MIRQLVLFSSLMVVTLTTYAQVNNESLSYSTASTSKTNVQTLSFAMGPSWITSKIYSPYGQKYSSRTGLEIGAEYTCVYSRGYGFGFTFMHNRTSYPMCAVRLNYIGPSFVYAGHFSEKWRGKVAIGLGYSSFDDEYDKQAGFGTLYQIGVEHQLTKHFGIGVTLQNIALYLGKNDDDYPGNSDDMKGVSRIGLYFNALYYF